MICLATLLHFYQPPTQVHSILDKITDESYRPLVNVLQSNSNARVTVNINGCLTEMLAEHGKSDVLKSLDELARRKQIEFTGSGMYHPILPLIPQSEMIRQINENRRTNQRLIGSSFQPRGFFPPEMCYGKNIIDPILSTGHEWVIMSGIACPVEWPISAINYINSSFGKLFVFFRDDVLSNRISFHEIDVQGFINHLILFNGDKSEDIYVVTAMDAETFGHHIKNWEKDFLDAFYKAISGRDTPSKRTNIRTKKVGKIVSTGRINELVKTVTISELLDSFKSGQAIYPRPSSWSTTDEDIKKDNPYPLWNDPDNQVHKLLWEHLNLTIDMVNKAAGCSDNSISQRFTGFARESLDLSLHSDQFWWASRRPQWDVNLIHRGLVLQQECLLNAYQGIRTCNSLDSNVKTEYHYRHAAAEDIANTIRRLLFDS